ncbi:MAG: hypothetical protein P8P30_00210 [Rickettsiales bacterium]|nr:hypothetical protein [Rickettsiales bacterium]
MKGWKTVLFNSLFAILGIVEESAHVLTSDADNAGYIVTGVAVANMILRGVTDTKMFSNR